MELIERAKEILESLEYINIATVSEDGQPWNTPVTGVHDSDLNFYWSSWKDAQHSINVRKNPKVFFTLYDSTRKRGDNNRRCLYFKATAEEVTSESEIEKAREFLYSSNKDNHPKELFISEGLRRIYKAAVSEVWLNDKAEYEVTKETVKMRIEVPIEGLKA